MRLPLDTNVLISFLRSKRPGESAVGAVPRAAIVGRCSLLYVEEVISELEQTLRERPDLAGRIDHRDTTRLIAYLRARSI